jgi:hypothetical protein
MNLIYPKDFHSTQTYQNANFSFPHDTGLSLSYDSLKKYFYNTKYLIPAYITYGNNNFKGNYGDIIKILQEDDNFAVLGTTFMRLKSLEEQLDNMFMLALEWKKKQIKPHTKFQSLIDKYITTDYYNQMLLTIGVVINYIQIMIINIIDYTVINHKTPSFLHGKRTQKLIDFLRTFVNITTINVTAGIVVYLIKIIPLIIIIYDYIAKNYNIVK